MGNDNELNHADIWLLMAIISASEPGREASLEGIISQGDRINHAIFSLSELNGGLERLMNAGFVIEKKNGYAPTEKALSIYDEVSKTKRYPMDIREGLENRLQVKPWDPSYKPHYDAPEKYVSREDLERAYKSYSKRFDKMFKEINKAKMNKKNKDSNKEIYEYDKVIKGEEAASYIRENLKRVRVDYERWEVEFIDEVNGERWIMDEPQSELHGGGPPRLRRIAKQTKGLE